MRKNTNKRYKKGGDISNQNGLRHILSIGYEIECANLMKLTKTETDNPDEQVLFNSDTTSNSILEFKKFETNIDDIDEDIIIRLEEMVEDVVLDDSGNVDTNSVFNITNDISLYSFSKKLKKACHYSESDSQDDDHTDEKNQMYLFRDTEDNEYNIHFLFNSNNNNECHKQTNVEWIFTYFKPKRSQNVIVDTFVNVIKNILRHVSDLEQINGKFIMKYNDENDVEQELIIDKPENRVLYHKPDTNLYYLQTQVSNMDFVFDDNCSKIQMTFSAKAENILTVMETILRDNLNSVPKINERLVKRLDILLNVKSCVEELFNRYNSSAPTYAFPAENKNVEIVKNYITLFLFKIERYYFFIKGSAIKTKYLKNVLFFNSRHGNHAFYAALKLKIRKLCKITEIDAIEIIQKLILQPTVLTKMVHSDVTGLRRGVFSPTNLLDKTHAHYGDPCYSLASYFQFFEDPVDTKMSNDWLVYKEIDNDTTNMELKNDVVLAECRNFQELLVSYVYSIADAELKNQMVTGSCNMLTGKTDEDVSGFSIANFKKIVELYQPSQKRSYSRSKTRKNTQNSSVKLN
ncbi:hypothetical protein EBU24_04170 [bacterium]|nr:hypothetical protein [bacterium]